MKCWRKYIGLIAACFLACQPSMCAQASAPAGNPQGQGMGNCPALSRDHPPRSEITLVELTFEGNLHMPASDQDEIATSLKQRTYWGTPEAAASELEERIRQAWQDRGYFKVTAHADAHLLTSSPTSEQITLIVHIDEGKQYRLEGIRFRNNTAISSVNALRNLFPTQDGEVFDRAAIAQGLENLRLAYGEFGYVNFVSVPVTEFNEERRTISLTIDMDEGKQFYVSSISVLGRDKRLLEDSPLQPGNIYNQRLARRFIEEHAQSSLADASTDSRIRLQLDERAATVAITYDFRACLPQGQQ
jgi:outer membrane protein assembly factor BamA